MTSKAYVFTNVKLVQVYKIVWHGYCTTSLEKNQYKTDTKSKNELNFNDYHTFNEYLKFNESKKSPSTEGARPREDRFFCKLLRFFCGFTRRNQQSSNVSAQFFGLLI